MKHLELLASLVLVNLYCVLNLLGLLPIPPAKIESGTAMFFDANLLQLNQKKLREIRGSQISMVFQDPMTPLNPYLTIGSQLIESLYVHRSI